MLFSGNLPFIIYVKHCENRFAYQQNLLKQCLKQQWKMRVSILENKRPSSPCGNSIEDMLVEYV